MNGFRQRLEASARPAPVVVPDETLVYYGEAVKALGGCRVGGYLVRFGDPSSADRQGEFFTGETYFGRAVKAGTDVVYHHGIPRQDRYALKFGNEVIGDGVLSVQEDGVTIEADLHNADDGDVKALLDEIAAGSMGWSSGSTERLVKRTPYKGAVRIDRWPIIEASLSPRPVDPRNKAYAIKSLLDPQPSNDSPSGAVATSLVDRAETLVAEVDAIRAAFADQASHRRAEGRELSPVKREAIKALSESLAELWHAAKARPDPQQIETLRRRLLRLRIEAMSNAGY